MASSLSSSRRDTVLVVGATGNTGRAVVRGLSQAVASSSSCPVRRVLGLTRDDASPAATALAALPHVEMLEHDWTKVDARWLAAQRVSRVYVASVNERSQFADESGVLLACRDARVDHVVKLSTHAPFLTPDAPMDYARAHWALEKLVQDPALAETLRVTVLRPNLFVPTLLDGLVAQVRAAETSGEKPVLRVLFAKDVPLAGVHPDDVGAAAAALLALPDASAHAGRVYEIHGPSDFTGEHVRRLLEAKAGTPLEIEFQSESLMAQVLPFVPRGQALRASLGMYLNAGKMGLATNPDLAMSPELLALGLPRTTLEEYIDRAFA